MQSEEFEALATAAFHAELVSSRRLAAREGVSLEVALRRTLTLAAAPLALEQLLQSRAAARAALALQREQRLQRRQEQRAARLAAGAPDPLAWLGWFDGSARPNPGRLGIGALLCGPGGERVEISRHAGDGDSGEAEYLALIALLEAATPWRPAQLVVYGDSRVVIDDVACGGAVRALAPLHARAAALLAGLGQLGQVELRWVPRHRNGAADRLSQLAASGPAP